MIKLRQEISAILTQVMIKLQEDYKKELPFISSTKWATEMVSLFEDKDYSIDIKNPIELPIPMQDGKMQLDPGKYEVELSSDKKNYIWTNPQTQERIVFPVDLINQPTENPDQTTGTEPAGTPPGPTEPGVAPPAPEQQAAQPAEEGGVPADLFAGL